LKEFRNKAMTRIFR